MIAERALVLAHLGRLDAATALIDGDGLRARHVLAYAAAARGRFDEALVVTSAVASQATDPIAAHRACVTHASILRQRRGYLDARRFDARALRLARSAEERAHALIGLAADAVGLADADACADALAQAGASAPPGAWRVAVRLGWVVAELAMVRDRPAHAAEAAAASAALARRAGAVRHEAKSLLFLGAAMIGTRDGRAATTLATAETRALGIGAAPIVRVARALLERV